MGIDLSQYRRMQSLRDSVRYAAPVSEEGSMDARANHVIEKAVDAALAEIINPVEFVPSDLPTSDYANGYAPDSISEHLPPRDKCGLSDPSIELDESQVAAINMLVRQQKGCLIGAAGSGKTTVTKYFLEKLLYGDEEMGLDPWDGLEYFAPGKRFNIALVAFTGMATQVIKNNVPEWLHGSVKTIHSLLEYSPTEVIGTNAKGEVETKVVFEPQRNKSNKLWESIIILDEASMPAVELWHAILDAARPGTKIFMIGDLNQLPPTAGQSIFAYALSTWPVAELTHIHRQKEPAANRIIDCAHAVLNGKPIIKSDAKPQTGEEFQFDDPSTNPNWRVLGYELSAQPDKAAVEIVAIANQLRQLKISASIDPTTPPYYDPYKDRIITAGNGYDLNNNAAGLDQFMINESLSRLIEPPTPEHPIYVIDAGRQQKRFAVNYRVMATKNEPPDVVDRVTNGMVGQIRSIVFNSKYSGNPNMVGPENEVNEYRREQALSLYGKHTLGVTDAEMESLKNFTMTPMDDIAPQDKVGVKEGSRAASHIITVEFTNGAIRQFASMTQVEGLMLAYASTCHKCQGSQFETAIIVVHHLKKSMLNREWFYTAVTRAQKRVIILYTPFGIKCAIAKQRIFGRTLKEKIQRYKDLAEESAEFNEFMGLKGKVIRLDW